VQIPLRDDRHRRQFGGYRVEFDRKPVFEKMRECGVNGRDLISPDNVFWNEGELLHGDADLARKPQG
jgi:hypothetical protein